MRVKNQEVSVCEIYSLGFERDEIIKCLCNQALTAGDSRMDYRATLFCYSDISCIADISDSLTLRRRLRDRDNLLVIGAAMNSRDDSLELPSGKQASTRER